MADVSFHGKYVTGRSSLGDFLLKGPGWICSISGLSVWFSFWEVFSILWGVWNFSKKGPKSLHSKQRCDHMWSQPGCWKAMNLWIYLLVGVDDAVWDGISSCRVTISASLVRMILDWGLRTKGSREVQVDQTACPLVGSGVLAPWIIPWRPATLFGRLDFQGVRKLAKTGPSNIRRHPTFGSALDQTSPFFPGSICIRFPDPSYEPSEKM